MPRRLTFTRLIPREQPLVFPALAFISGLWLASELPLSPQIWFATAASLWLVALVCLLRRQGHILTALLLAGACACGGTLWELDQASVSESRIRKLFARGSLSAEEPVEVWGTLKLAPELAPDRIYLSLAVERVASARQERVASGMVWLSVRFTDAQARREYDALGLDYGTRVRAWAYLTAARGFRNPGAPDFDEFLERRGYDAAGLIKSPLLIEPLGAGESNALLRFLYRWRARALAAILRSFTQPTAGILAAALLGNQHFLSRETAETFRASGAFHLLIISGLHVALIAGLIFRLTRRWARHRLLRGASVVAPLWGYALMVGAQPAIRRAVVMITVVLGAHLVFRLAVGANTLAAAALALLIWQPGDLHSPGLQLSFLAVLLIVTGTVPLYHRLKSIGEWQPTEATPYPPRAPAWVKWCAEALFWDDAAFRREMERAPIRYRLEKARAARWLSRRFFRSRLAAQPAVRWVMLTWLTTVCVQVGLLPLMILYFRRVAVIAPLTNVIESALVFALMIAGAAYLLLYAVSAAVALKLAWIVNACGWLTAHAADPLLDWRGASLRVPHGGSGLARLYALYFVLVLLALLALSEWNPLQLARAASSRLKLARRTLTGLTLVALGLLCVLLIWHPFTHDYERGRLSVTFLDVGQGDAAVVSFPRGALMLVDSGGRILYRAEDEMAEDTEAFVEDHLSIGEVAVASYLWQRGIKRLDLIAATHGHADHMEGFADIIRGFDIGAALTGASSNGDDQLAVFRKTVAGARVPLRTLQRGERLELDGVRLEVLAPFPEARAAPRSSNNDSLVLRLSYGARAFLLTGDIEREAEARLVAAGDELRADVLKVAHHGSRTSSTAEFLARAAPRYAVISAASPSPFGHPHAEALDRLRQTGARILQTSACGAITISTDGRDLRVATSVTCE
jgi:competence protein ComEC